MDKAIYFVLDLGKDESHMRMAGVFDNVHAARECRDDFDVEWTEKIIFRVKPEQIKSVYTSEEE